MATRYTIKVKQKLKSLKLLGILKTEGAIMSVPSINSDILNIMYRN